MHDVFASYPKVRFEGADTTTPLAFRHYDPQQKVQGRPMRDHLRFAAAFWHPFNPAPDIAPPASPEFAQHKIDTAFELFQTLDLRYFNIAHTELPEDTADTWVRDIGTKVAKTGVKLLCGHVSIHTPIEQILRFMDRIHALGAEGIVLSAERPPYDIRQSIDHNADRETAGQALHRVLAHKARIGFSGSVMLTPAPLNAGAGQYDYDVARLMNFLTDLGLEAEVDLSLDYGQSNIAGHRFDHELALARQHGVLGGISMNRANARPGREVGEFVNTVPETALSYYEVLRAGGFKSGGTSFDARLQQHPMQAEALLLAHITAMDACAAGLVAAADVMTKGVLD